MSENSFVSQKRLECSVTCKKNQPINRCIYIGKMNFQTQIEIELLVIGNSNYYLIKSYVINYSILELIYVLPIFIYIN